MDSAIIASEVERRALAAAGEGAEPPADEKARVIVVENFPALGKLAAFRFLEWVAENPEGVVSLPTGKTPEHFISWVGRCLSRWDDMGDELEAGGLDPARKPSTSGLRFVQIDEFYPMDGAQQNSFLSYVRKFYLKGFGIPEERALLIDVGALGLPAGTGIGEFWGDEGVDLDLRYRLPRTKGERLRKDAIARVDQFCDEYEERVRALGGIGFFLGGIGPDGHIGFNVRGSDSHSTTRLCKVNYETQAAASGDLGGMEVASKRLVITIGLGTIKIDPRCAAIVMAAGEAKAAVVRDAVSAPAGIEVPASALRSLPGLRFYLTDGAASLLRERRLRIAVAGGDRAGPPERALERALVDLSLRTGRRLLDLGAAEVEGDPFCKAALARAGAGAGDALAAVDRALKEKIERGTRLRAGKRFLHTEPHHDDIMLGYLPFAVRHIRDASCHHHFATLTSGFTAVTNGYMLKVAGKMEAALAAGRFEALLKEGYFEDRSRRDEDVWAYLDGVAADSAEGRDEGLLRRFLRDLVEVFDERRPGSLLDRVRELQSYFATQYPGKKDLPFIQQLKGRCREWESACLWGYFGWNSPSVENLRLGFYTGDIFTEEPEEQRDMVPVLDLIERTRPDVVTVAFDPEASGPDTHYKVLQAVAGGLKLYEEREGRKDIEVVGYRNVWYRFHPADASMFVPVSLNMFSQMRASFAETYISQRDASFPSHEHDGPFSELAQRIQVEQFKALKTCVGERWFYDNPSPLMRATRGFVFLSSMTTDEFYASSRRLREMAEGKA